MKKLLLSALVLVTLFPIVPAEAQHPTFVSIDCFRLRVEPHKIVFACADGGYYVDHLHWSFWRRDKAKATGIFHFNDCDPSCAGGTFHQRRGRLFLTRRHYCDNVKRFVFDRARGVFDHPYRGRDHETVDMGCPIR